MTHSDTHILSHTRTHTLLHTHSDKHTHTHTHSHAHMGKSQPTCSYIVTDGWARLLTNRRGDPDRTKHSPCSSTSTARYHHIHGDAYSSQEPLITASPSPDFPCSLHHSGQQSAKATWKSEILGGGLSPQWIGSQPIQPYLALPISID